MPVNGDLGHTIGDAIGMDLLQYIYLQYKCKEAHKRI